MAIYKRYNTHRKKIDRRIVISLSVIVTVFILTVLLGLHLGKKAEDSQPLYTGQVQENADGETLAPITEKSVLGEYVAPEKLKDFTADNINVFASTWLYRNGKTPFATETDKKLGNNTKGLVPLDVLNTERGVLGLFEVKGLYSDEQIKGVITEYELSLINEFAECGTREIVLVFQETTEENYKAALEFVEKTNSVTMICVPYTMLGSQEFFSAAADKGIAVALITDKLTEEQLESDINTYAFYFTKYNIRLVLSEKERGLVDILKKHTVLNYQFYS